MDDSKRGVVVSLAAERARRAPPAPSDALIDEVIVRYHEDEDVYCATIAGLPAAGVAPTEGEAIRCLARLLASFVRGHAKTIDDLRGAEQR